MTENNITPFRDKDDKYTDFRVLLRDTLLNDGSTAKGIVVWIHDDGNIRLGSVCSSSQMAFAAAHLLKQAAGGT